MNHSSDCTSNDIAATIQLIRKGIGEYKGNKQFEVNSEIVFELKLHLDSIGKFYFDKMYAYYLNSDSKELIILKSKDRRTELFLSQFGLFPLEKEYQYSLKALELHALKYGTEAKVHSFTHYCRETNTIYLFDQDKHVYKITNHDIAKVSNGTDSILFFNKTGSKPFELTSLGKQPETNLFHDLLLVPLKFTEAALSSEEYCQIIYLWFLSIFMPDLFPTKSILAVIGEHKSGKTTFIRSLGRVLSGSTFQVTLLPSDVRSFDILLANSHYVAIDNADSPVSWLEDRIATVATGGTVQVRRLYSNSDLCELEISTYLAISSRTPRFRRPDIADRCLIIPLERMKGLETELDIQDEVIENRDTILTEIAFRLQDVLLALEEQEDMKYQSQFRMADFGLFALKLAKHEGKQDQMLNILEKLCVKQEEFTAEGEPIIDILEIWLRDPDNANTHISAADLYIELNGIA